MTNDRILVYLALGLPLRDRANARTGRELAGGGRLRDNLATGTNCNLV